MARPPSVRTRRVLWGMDAQVLTELAIKAMRQNKAEDAIRAMQMAYTVYRLATGEIEGIGNG